MARTEIDRDPDYRTEVNDLPVWIERTGYGSPAFDHAVGFMLTYETRGDVRGGRPHQKSHDPGGFTKYGVAQNFHPDVDVENLTYEKAVQFYHQKHWKRLNIDEIEDPRVQVALFDFSMNTEVGAADAAQQIAVEQGRELFGGGFKPGGDRALLGKKTAAAVNAYVRENGADTFIEALNDKRIERIDTRSNQKDRAGLRNRVADLEEYLKAVPPPDYRKVTRGRQRRVSGFVERSRGMAGGV